MRTVVCAVAAAALTFGAPAAALAHQGNPNYRSVVNRVMPATPGVNLSVLNYDDRLLLNDAGRADVVVLDYQRKPYIHAAADGTVAVNTNSEAYYLNEDRYGQSAVPKGLGSQPAWKVVSRNGRYDWHDHRIHWMSQGAPPQVKDKGVRTKINDWTVPVRVNGKPGAISGTLTWVPSASQPLPLGAIFAFAALLILLSLGVFVARRRRGRRRDDARVGGATEAW